MVHRVWKANGLKPYRVRTFKLSRDPAGSPPGGSLAGRAEPGNRKWIVMDRNAIQGGLAELEIRLAETEIQ